MSSNTGMLPDARDARPAKKDAGHKKRKCAALTVKGTPCKSYAMHGSDFCAAHSGKVGAPPCNQNRTTHGFYSKPRQVSPSAGLILPTEGGQAPRTAGLTLNSIEDVIADALQKQARLSAILDATDDADTDALVKLFALYGQNSSRLGRLLRDQRALSGESADGLLDAIGKALDEISTELGVEL